MSRSYAVAVMLLAVAMFGGLVGFHFHHLNTAEEETLTRAYDINQWVIADQLEELQSLDRSMRELLDDPSKYKFQPILTVFDQAEVQLKKLNDGWYNKQRMDSDPRVTLQTIGIMANTALYHVAEAAKNLYRNHGNDLDLTKEHVATKVATVEKFITEEAVFPASHFPRKARQQIEVEQQLIMLSTLSKMRELLLSVNAVGCTRGLENDNYFPVIMGKGGDVDRLEKRTMKIGVGSYQAPLDPSDVVIKVDGKVLPIGEDGTASYLLPTASSGNKMMSAEIMVTNKLTGEVRSGNGSYHYRVR